ncbi:unnamed protein product [Urochloa decumbens]|uniref:Uncharacterized protein n=1 Tax=Urochloa decumbens TaxID=240449 RepID=A0ABC8Z497_9POAL
MSATRCVKLLLLLTLIPLALRAASLLLAGHAAPPPPSSSHRHSTIRSGGAAGEATATATGRASASVSATGSAHGRPYHPQTRHRRRRTAEESALDAFDGTRRLRQADAAGWLEDDKRLAPTGSNPLHNLR